MFLEILEVESVQLTLEGSGLLQRRLYRAPLSYLATRVPDRSSPRLFVCLSSFWGGAGGGGWISYPYSVFLGISKFDAERLGLVLGGRQYMLR